MRRVGVAQPLDAHSRLQHDTDDIEARQIEIEIGAASVITRGDPYALALFFVYGLRGLTVLLSLAGLDLDENKRLAMPRDKVRFARAGSGAVITRHDLAATAAQKRMREVLADPTGILAPRAAANGVRKAIKNSEHNPSTD